MNIDQKGLDALKKFEGFSKTAYWDYHGYSIGYGHLGAKKEDVITLEEGEALLKLDVAKFEDAVNKAVKVPLTQNQFNALTSFTYNVGIGALQKSTLLKKLNAGDTAGAALEFKRWTKAGGKTHPGLVARRAAETKMFLS